MDDAAYKADVGILAVREDELAALHERFPKERDVRRQRGYSLSRVPLDKGEHYDVAISRVVPTTGRNDYANAVRCMVADVSPNMILLVDTASSPPSYEVTLGDVVVGTRVVQWVYRKPLMNGPVHDDLARWAYQLSHVGQEWYRVPSIGASPTLPGEPKIESPYSSLVKSALAQHFSGAWDFRPEEHRKSRPPRVVAGTIVANKVNLLFLDEFMSSVGETPVAIDVGAWEAYQAADALKKPLMSIYGISEILGLQRDAKWSQYASKLAASFTLAFLKTRPIAPRPPAQHEAITREPLPDRPIDLTRVHTLSKLVIEDVRGFPKLDLACPSPRPDEGQWMILIGENGVGKTTLLRALALALSPAEVAPAILSRTSATSPNVRVGAAQATIRVAIPGEEQVTMLHIEPAKGGERLGRRVFADVPMPFLAAYGARRGSGLAGRSAEIVPVAAVETLFDEGANLIQPDEWLRGWQLAALQGGEESTDARFFQGILSTLYALLPGVEKIHVSRESVDVEGPTLGRIPLGALSDGYRTTMGWVLDMIARWVEEAKRRSLPIEQDFHQSMTGIVLIDEIDLYLHPRWQRDAISMVRRRFPKMSFVVTTHNPLTLLGAKSGEVYVLRRSEHGEMEVLQRDVAPGADADQVLTGDWFGLHSTRDNETLRMLAEHHRFILEKGLDSPEALAMEEQLRRRLGSYDNTSIERIARGVAAEVIGEEPRPLTPDERRRASQKVAELIGSPIDAAKQPTAAKRPRHTKKAAKVKAPAARAPQRSR